MLLSALTAKGDDWRMHVSFDEDVTGIMVTPDYVYFTSKAQATEKGYPDYRSLFRYDIENDELEALSTDNLLSGNVASCVAYSPGKGMLAVVYPDSMIDLIYDDGRSVSIPDYKYANTGHDKTVNSIFIDDERDMIYLATGFGYIAINEKKHEISESRIYDADVTAMTRFGDKLGLLSESVLYAAPISEPRLKMTDYKEVLRLNNAQKMESLSASKALVWSSEKGITVSLIENEEDDFRLTPTVFSGITNMERNKAGVLVGATSEIWQFYADGTYDKIPRHAEDTRKIAGSNDLKEIWIGEKRKGISSKRYDRESGEWTLTRDFMRTNSPAPFGVSEMTWHPTRGLLVVNHGVNHNFTLPNLQSPILLCAYKDGHWSYLSPAYTNPDAQTTLNNPNGLAVDPDNQDLVYFGSVKHGMERINMSDGTDVLHLSRENDPYKDEPGFVAIVPDMTAAGSWKELASFNTPVIDYYGNLWTVWVDTDHQNPKNLPVFCWEASDRRASTDASAYRPMKRIDIAGVKPTNQGHLTALKREGRRNIILYTNGAYDGEIVMLDFGGTPSDTSDDKVTAIRSFEDQDGNKFDVHNIACFHEDPETGNVWVGHRFGVFHFNPDDFINGEGRVTRLKIARNDGTNLADYLLDLVAVNKIMSDGRGKKWFATSGAGAICTSSDGREIEEEVTADNSRLPHNNVYGMGYIPTSNSILFSTEYGLAEYFMSGTATSGGGEEVRAYPNPVRPEYYGYVTIDGLENGTLVKITDASGNIVKELGPSGGGEVKWDVTDHNYRRVGSGIYFILCSSTASGDGFSKAGKIMVIN